MGRQADLFGGEEMKALQIFGIAMAASSISSYLTLCLLTTIDSSLQRAGFSQPLSGVSAVTILGVTIFFIGCMI
jgi:hypothetical protein